MTDTLFLFASIADTPVAIRASQIEAVVRIGDIVPIPLMPPYVRGLAALRSRVLTVIDMDARVFGTGRGTQAATLAIIADIAAHSYGFLVDSVSDICTAAEGIQPIRGRIDPAWAPFASGLVEWDGRSHLLLSLPDFVGSPAGSALAA
ncbi:chemotaxis protein CheW [Sphingobium lignivorans]|uniref:Purine-binding chemotaxis protein CheW n=1 Tax=Sphingobium lignivorans TaxID=2735886 RepID=A0ABR6NAU1_9SPHN|nr:chemotaxis protein CheW [Sphingobium lignivorans]MBB5984400.1 purine-binding chemotaxis protein CheW [Sphingobium lignivorans]